MADLLVICDACSTPFITSNFIEGDGEATVILKDVRVRPCPQCGGEGRAVDGAYRLFKNTLSMLLGHSPQQLAQLYDLLSRSGSSDDIASKVDRELPEFSEVIRSQPSGLFERKDWVNLLIALILFVIGPAYNSLTTDEPPS
ncbi:hypothetical protein ACPF8X_45000, partial [Streptomyces sp. G35A]